MDNSSENTGERVVSEVAPTFNEHDRARKLIKEIGGHCWSGKGDLIDRVYDAVRQAYPRGTWTRRRLRAFWHKEQAGVRWREMRELEFVAEVEGARRLRREAERVAHNEFLADIANTLDRLEATDAEFHSAHRAALSEMAGRSLDQALGSAARQGDRVAVVGGAHFRGNDR